MLRLVIDDKIPFVKGQAEKLGKCVYVPGEEINAAIVKEADALMIRTRTQCNEDLLQGSAVKFIATATIGFDHLDTEYLKKANIAWSNCPGCNAGAVAQYIECSLLRLEKEQLIPPLSECSVGIVGVGHVGAKVAEALANLGCRILRNDPPRKDVENTACFEWHDMNQLQCEADVITFHTPLTYQGAYPSYHLADDAFFERLRKSPIIINSSRGEVVKTAALKKALLTGKVRQAVLDTWENEPAIDRELLSYCFIGTPHIAGYSADGKANGSRMALKKIADYFHLKVDFEIYPPCWGENQQFNPNELPFCPAIRFYDPFFDSQKLKANPDLFEQLRGNYPLRREGHYFV